MVIVLSVGLVLGEVGVDLIMRLSVLIIILIVVRSLGLLLVLPTSIRVEISLGFVTWLIVREGALSFFFLFFAIITFQI